MRRLTEVRDLEVLAQWASVWKTHAGYRSHQCGEGRHVWLTPHGLAFLVDHLGTRQIDPAKAREMYDAPAGVDLYFT